MLKTFICMYTYPGQGRNTVGVAAEQTVGQRLLSPLFGLLGEKTRYLYTMRLMVKATQLYNRSIWHNLDTALVGNTGIWSWNSENLIGLLQRFIIGNLFFV